MLKRLKSVSMMLFLMGASTGAAYAVSNPGTDDVKITQQSSTCTGVVVDATGETVIGASVVVKGTTNGTITGIDGDFSLNNVKKGDIIQISFVGYQTVEIPWNGQPLNVTLQDDTQTLQEVVVTALGVKREKKALGYAMQEVKGDALLNARETNLANALTGKVSGVQIIRSSNGPGGSSKIQLRGSNSVTGLNQPLIVVDGVPMDNFLAQQEGASKDIFNPGQDMGNGLSDINPEDIESMSVLKGASAAALYGSRAGNGVILITTKSGKESKGLGITISGSVSAETIFMKPEMQKSFGQGYDGAFNNEETRSWGEEIAGQEITKWDGSRSKMAYYDNIDNYFRTGTNLTESIAFSQQYGKTGIYASVNRMDDHSKIPGADISRTNMMLRGTSTFGKDDRWTLDAKVQYILSDAKNRPVNGDGSNFLTMYKFPVSLDIRDFSAATDENGDMLWFGTSSARNPYWSQKYALSNDVRNRFLLNGSLKYKFTDWLNAEIKAGSDMYYTEETNKLYGGSPTSKTGSYAFSEKKFFENNFSFLISANKDNIFGNWGGAASFGGNLMERKSTGIRSDSGELVVKNLFSLNNGKNKPTVNDSYSHKKMNSLYGTAQINYNGWLFLDGTFRNDWTSTLSKNNRSFFYPSVSASWVISDMINKHGKGMPEWFTYAKARISYAEVGNDMDPYQLYNTYSIGSDPNGNKTTTIPGTLYNTDVKNELISSWEAGAEIRFFNNRLGLDFTWYKSNAKNQLLDLPMNSLSGYTGRKINAGNIQNSGIEIMLNATPVQSNDFNWDLQFNFSTNKNKILELADGVEKYQLGPNLDNMRVYAVVGGNYGEIWGSKFARVEDESSPYYGQLITTKEGRPTAKSGDIEKIGDQQATCLLGLTNTFSYKGWTLSFLVDARIGGEIFSATNHTMQKSGTAKITAPGGKRENIIVEGVYMDDNGNYTPNTTPITQQQYWEAVTTSSGNLGIGEANLYDATNVRLRNLSLNYTFPKSMLAKTPFQQVKLGVSCNNVWMISSHMRGVDPESVFATYTNATGFEAYSAPTSRTFLFNVTLGF